MKKDDLVRQMRSIAAANGGNPPGSQLFETVTGVQKQHWQRLWLS